MSTTSRWWTPVIWESDADSAQRTAYHEFNDSTNALMVSGLYQYTVRDLWNQLFPANALSDEDRQQIDDYVTEYEAAQTDNDYTGLFAGKNVIMVQLEAIDTWMLSDYMPNLAKLKAEGISFTNHYTPAYITAGTFNTEFMTNTGLLPATGGIPTSVYTNDSFPYSMANLFAKAGYTVRPSTTARERSMTGRTSTPTWAMKNTTAAATWGCPSTSWTASSSTALPT